MRTLIVVVVLTSGVLAQSEPVSLAAARELYAAADYRAALVMLDRLATADPARQDRPAVELYRAFCLIALDRMNDADEAILR